VKTRFVYRANTTRKTEELNNYERYSENTRSWCGSSVALTLYKG